MNMDTKNKRRAVKGLNQKLRGEVDKSLGPAIEHPRPKEFTNMAGTHSDVGTTYSQTFKAPTGSMREINLLFAKLNQDDPLIHGFMIAAERTWAVARGQVSFSAFWSNARFLDLEAPKLRKLWESYIHFLETMKPARVERIESLDPQDKIWLLL